MTGLRRHGAVAPSARLLCFLRSQVDRFCFVGQNVQNTHENLISRDRQRQASFSPDLRLYRPLNPLSGHFNTRYTNPQTPTSSGSLSATVFPQAQSTKRSVTRSSGGSHCNRSFNSSLWSGSPSAGSARRRQYHGDAHVGSRDVQGLATDATGTTFGRSKAVNELKLRCTEFDENGNVVLVSGEFKKSELIAKYGLLPRDLRKIDSSSLPSILVRPSAILVNLLHLRVLIKHNCVLVFDVYGSTNSYTQSVFMYDLEGKLMQKEASRAIMGGGLPYEFRALEAVLISVTSGLEGEFEGIREPVVRVLRELEEDIDRDKLRHLLVYSKKLGTFEQKARLVRDAIDSLLEEDEDLSGMYLSETAQGQERAQEDHTEIEMLLESYYRVCDEIVQNSSNLVSNIRNTEEIVKAILDANRNSLMLLDLKFSIGTLGIGSGTFIAGLYGMNLKNFVEESDFGFWGISGVSGVIAGIVCIYGIRKLRRVQRVSMWGAQGRAYRRNWRSVDSPASLPGEDRQDKVQKLMEQRRRWSELQEAQSRKDLVETRRG